MNKFLHSNTAGFRLARTIAQGIIGVVIANLDLFVSTLSIPQEYKPVIVAAVMAVLSPVMAMIDKESED